jgi:hypothetical protein
MRSLVFILACVAAFAIWRGLNPPSPYAVVVPIDRRPGIDIVVVEPPPPAPIKPGPKMDVGL